MPRNPKIYYNKTLHCIRDFRLNWNEKPKGYNNILYVVQIISGTLKRVFIFEEGYLVYTCRTNNVRQVLTNYREEIQSLAIEANNLLQLA